MPFSQMLIALTQATADRHYCKAFNYIRQYRPASSPVPKVYAGKGSQVLYCSKKEGSHDKVIHASALDSPHPPACGMDLSACCQWILASHHHPSPCAACCAPSRSRRVKSTWKSRVRTPPLPVGALFHSTLPWKLTSCTRPSPALSQLIRNWQH